MTNAWQRKHIGDLCEVVAGQSPEGRFYNTDGKGMPFYQGKKDFGEKFIQDPTTWTTHTIKIAREGDILMSVRAPVGPVNFATDEVCIGRGLAAIRSSAELNRDFLFYQLLYLQPGIAGKEGAVFASINKSEIEDLPLAFVPLPEQRRIVRILDEAFEGIATAKAHAEKNIQNAGALFESYLQSVFTQRGKDWTEKTLGDVCRFFQGLAINQKTKHLLVSKSSLPLLRIKDLRDNTVEQYVSEVGYPPNALVDEDDILYTRTGNSLGLVFTGRKGVLHNNSFKISPDPSLRKDYLFWWLQTASFRRRIFLLASKAAQPDISHSIFKEQPIAVPPLKEQKAIAQRVVEMSLQVNSLEGVYHRKLIALDGLKGSLLHQAFTGKL